MPVSLTSQIQLHGRLSPDFVADVQARCVAGKARERPEGHRLHRGQSEDLKERVESSVKQKVQHEAGVGHDPGGLPEGTPEEDLFQKHRTVCLQHGPRTARTVR